MGKKINCVEYNIFVLQLSGQLYFIIYWANKCGDINNQYICDCEKNSVFYNFMILVDFGTG